MPPLRVLIVDDSEKDTALLLNELWKAGYTPLHKRIDTKEEMEQALTENWDVILCDYVMPGFSGLAAIEILRKKDTDIPVIVVSGHIGEDIAVETMKAGAQDYIIKNNLKRLCPAVERELAEAENRRQRKKAEEELKKYHANLEKLVNERTTALTDINQMLQKEITEHRKLEKALESSEERYRTIVTTANEGIWMVNGKRETTYVNARMAQMLGYTIEELMQKPWRELVKQEGIVFSDEIVSKRKQERQGSQTYDFELIRKDGTNLWVTINATPLYDDAGTYIGSVSMLTDITERLKAQQSVQFERDRLISILDAMEDGVCIMDRDYTVEYVNPSMISLFGAVGDRKCYKYFNDRENVCEWCNNREIFAGKTQKRDVLSNNGRNYEIVDAPLKNADGTISKLAVFHDITERKKVEQLKDEFIGMVSHELRTPLTVIMGALSTAQDKRIEPEQKSELLNDAVLHSEILANIIDNLLELSRQQSGRLVVQTQPTDIGDVTRSVLQKLKTKSEIHQLAEVIPDTLPPLIADPIRMERILYNLVDNAIKYSPNGGEVKVSALQDGDYLIVSVSDQGPGISADDQARLFQSFERLGVTVKGSIQGTGLGLRVCRILVEAHGGRIWVKSEKGKGSTFLFSLPVSKRLL